MQSIYSGNVNLLLEKLRISPSRKVDEVVLTIGTVPIDSIKGVRVSGRVSGLLAGSSALTKVILHEYETGSPGIETTPNPDGTFEFAKVPPRRYVISVSGLPDYVVGNDILNFNVGKDDISGVSIPLKSAPW